MTRPEPRHGTVSGYVNLPCRERCCRDAMAAYRRARRAVLRTRPVPAWIPHGTESTATNYVCMCKPCRDAHNAARRDRYARAKQAAP